MTGFHRPYPGIHTVQDGVFLKTTVTAVGLVWNTPSWLSCRKNHSQQMQVTLPELSPWLSMNNASKEKHVWGTPNATQFAVSFQHLDWTCSKTRACNSHPGSVTVLVCLAWFNEQFHVFIENLNIRFFKVGYLIKSQKTSKTNQADSNDTDVWKGCLLTSEFADKLF